MSHVTIFHTSNFSKEDKFITISGLHFEHYQHFQHESRCCRGTLTPVSPLRAKSQLFPRPMVKEVPTGVPHGCPRPPKLIPCAKPFKSNSRKSQVMCKTKNSTSTHLRSQLHSATSSGFSSSWHKKKTRPNHEDIKRANQIENWWNMQWMSWSGPTDTALCRTPHHYDVYISMSCLCLYTPGLITCLYSIVLFSVFWYCWDIPVTLLDLPSHFRSCLSSLPSPHCFGPLETGVPTVTAIVSALGLFSLASVPPPWAAAEWESWPGPWAWSVWYESVSPSWGPIHKALWFT